MNTQQEKEQWSPKRIIAEFKKVLDEAASFYDKPVNTITGHEFFFVSGGRVGRSLVNKIGGYSRLKNYLYPAVKGQPNQAAKQLIEKILSR